MSNNFIPSTDSDFSMWSNTLLTTLSGDPAGYGLDAADITDLEQQVQAWDNSYSDLYLKRDEARAATVGKDLSRKTLEETIRNLARQIQANPNVPATEKAKAGLPVHATTRTPVPVPNTAPLASIDAKNIREHSLRFSDSLNVRSRVRPRGVTGIEIWMYCGDQPPVDDGQFQMYTTATRMSANVSFTSEQAGKTAWYQFRYVNTRGEVGPWSMIYSSTVLK